VDARSRADGFLRMTYLASPATTAPKKVERKGDGMARSAARSGRTETYKHPQADLALRPEVGTQPQFRKNKKKPPATYRYDSSLAPALDWDGENSVREQGEWLIACIDDASRLPAPHEFEARESVVPRTGSMSFRPAPRSSSAIF
jgi:hypothetical protein